MGAATETYPISSTKFTPSHGIVVPTMMVVGWLCLALVSTWIWPDVTQSGLSTFGTYLKHASGNAVVMGGMGVAVGLLVIARRYPDLSLKRAVSSFLKNYGDSVPVTLGRASIGLIAFAAFLYAYSTIKVRIPEMAPFSWDARFAEWDRAVFLGRDAWMAFAWIYDFPWAVRALGKLYDVWAGLLVAAWMLPFLMSAEGGAANAMRFRFPVALLLVWFVGGNVMALWMSSAGPVYFEPVVGTGLYNDQLEILSGLSLVATDYQAMLWDVYEGPGLGVGGISAMPSMHCATSLLFVCALWNRPVWRAVAMVFSVVIWASSIILAWHYAVDGLVAIPLVILCWWAAGKMVRRVAGTAS